MRILYNQKPYFVGFGEKNFLKIFLRSISLYKENEDFVGYNPPVRSTTRSRQRYE